MKVRHAPGQSHSSTPPGLLHGADLKYHGAELLPVEKLDMPKIEFAEWDTPFKVGKLDIFDVQYGNGGIHREDAVAGLSFDVPPRADRNPLDLFIRLLHVETRSVYSLLFRQVGAFRVLDEHGLLQIWEARSAEHPGAMTFKVRGEAWPTESPISFLATDGWSFMIATEDTCV
jgi:hypothetical protein